MYCVKQKNLIPLAERVSHNRFCDRNLLKIGRKYFFKKSERATSPDAREKQNESIRSAPKF
jgi:hypothetical protein